MDSIDDTGGLDYRNSALGNDLKQVAEQFLKQENKLEMSWLE